MAEQQKPKKKNINSFNDLMNAYSKEMVISLNKEIKPIDKIPFSSPYANYMCYGGLPRGKLIEFGGEENSGKTTTALDVVKNAQKLFYKEWEEEVDKLEAITKRNKTEQAKLDNLVLMGPKRVFWVDCENTFDTTWAIKLGVNMDDLYIASPENQGAETIFQMVEEGIETDEIGLVVIDSLGIMMSDLEYEKSIEEKTYGGIAMALTKFSKKAAQKCQKHNCTLIGINQVRENLGSPYGGTTSPGGKAWRHNCSVRILFKKGAYIDMEGKELLRSAENPAGNLVEMYLIKTKCFVPDRKFVKYTLNYYEGIDYISDTIQLCIALGFIIKGGGGWHTFVDLNNPDEMLTDEEGALLRIQGSTNVPPFFKENTTLFDEYYNKLLSEVGSSSI